MESNKRPVHLGIDYGTSTSKIVLRDYAAPGGERSILIGRDLNYRYSSTVLVGGGKIYLGSGPKDILVHDKDGMVRYESVKMRVADEVKKCPGRYCFGPLYELPGDFRAQDFATLTVWSLISEGYLAARNELELNNVRLGMTLGIPMSFFADIELRDVFIKIARTAWHLFKTQGPLRGYVLRLGDVRQWLDDAYHAVELQGPIPADQIRNWVRSESEAAMLWAFRSPSVSAGPYIKVDVGAGTTNASMFRIVDSHIDGKWIKTGFAFFGTFSGPYGMDAVDHALAKQLGISVQNCLTLRGQEDGLLQDPMAFNSTGDIFEKIRSSVVTAWQRGYKKIMGSQWELKAWNKANMFVVGGGSLVNSLRNFLLTHPSGQLHAVRQRQLEIPIDLYTEDDSSIAVNNLPFVVVAYGLSNLGIAVPEAETPDDIPPMKVIPIRERMNYEDIYGEM